jgi:hypothetical protein
MVIYKNTEVPIYCGRLHIAISTDFKEDIPKLNKLFKENFTMENDVLGMSQKRGHHNLVIINVDKHIRAFKSSKLLETEVIATISHEAIHTCNTIFRDKGIKLDVDNDEPQAYLVDWLVKQIYWEYLKTKENGKVI